MLLIVMTHLKLLIPSIIFIILFFGCVLAKAYEDNNKVISYYVCPYCR